LGFEQFGEVAIRHRHSRELTQTPDIAPLGELADIAQRYRALVGVAHALKGLVFEPDADE
jgi:hypothetical protein